MKAIAVMPGKKHSAQVVDARRPGQSIYDVIGTQDMTTDDVYRERGINLLHGFLFVLGNKVMVGTVNANREYFELGVRDMTHAESAYPGWLASLLMHPVDGLDRVGELFEKLGGGAKDAIKVYCEVFAAAGLMRRPAARACAKLRHASDVPCVFCGQGMAPPAAPRAA